VRRKLYAATVLLTVAASALVLLWGWWLSPETAKLGEGEHRTELERGEAGGKATAVPGPQRIFALEEPPREPPPVSVVLPRADLPHIRSRPAPEKSTRREGQLVYYSWVDGGEPRYREPASSVRWPEPVDIHSNDALINLGTRVMPQRLEVLVYDKLGPGGVPSLGTVHRFSCLSGVVGGDAKCSLVKQRDAKSRNWTIEVPTKSCRDKCYVAVSSIWISAGDPIDRSGTRPVQEDSASWIFSLNVE
jgi:hypothetical protein